MDFVPSGYLQLRSAIDIVVKYQFAIDPALVEAADEEYLRLFRTGTPSESSVGLPEGRRFCAAPNSPATNHPRRRALSRGQSATVYARSGA